MRTVLALLPVLVSFWLLAAHWFRAGLFLPMALALLAPLLLCWRSPRAVLLVRIGLLLGAMEWLRTGVVLALARHAAGAPFVRLALIMGGVALMTAAASLVFRLSSLRAWYDPIPPPLQSAGEEKGGVAPG